MFCNWSRNYVALIVIIKGTIKQLEVSRSPRVMPAIRVLVFLSLHCVGWAGCGRVLETGGRGGGGLEQKLDRRRSRVGDDAVYLSGASGGKVSVIVTIVELSK